MTPQPHHDEATELLPHCRLHEIVAAMPSKANSTIFCRRDGQPAAVPYPQCLRDASVVSAALLSRGVRRGDRVAIHGSTSYEWILADLACVLAGAVSVTLYPNAPTARVVATAQESRCRVVCTDRADSAASFAAAGLDVVVLSSRTGRAGTPTIGDLLTGEIVTPAPQRPEGFDRDAFTIVSTSGTLSVPKLFAVHSAPLIYTMNRFTEIFGLSGRDRLLLYLPLAHLPQRMMLYWGLDTGIDFVLSDPAHMVADSARLDPTLHVAVPRSLQHLRWLARTTTNGRTTSSGSPTTARQFHAVFGPAVRAIFVGSAASDAAVLADLSDAGLPVYEIYGTTELGIIAFNAPGWTRLGTVGRPIPWGNVQVGHDSGEILVQTPTPFLHGRLIDGRIEPSPPGRGVWRPTGDVGALDADGFLTVRGRIRDFLPLSSGEKVFLRPIEDAATEATAASLTVITMTNNSQLGALLFFDPAAVDATNRDGTVDRCRSRLQVLNQTLHPWERIRAFSIFGRLPSAEEGTLTDTTKLRRHMIDEVYAREAIWYRVTGG
jgi:long-chain acyl-CoA synthetase